MKLPSLAVALALPLAACGSSSSPTIHEENASVSEVSKSVEQASASGALRFNPGRWESNISIDEMSIPGLPPQAQAMMKKRMGQLQTTSHCLTPEDAKKPTADFFSGKSDCRYDHFTMAGGTLDAKMVCSHGGESQTFELNGTYSPDAYQMVMQGSVTGGGEGHQMNMKMHVDAKRVGACTGKEDS